MRSIRSPLSPTPAAPESRPRMAPIVELLICCRRARAVWFALLLGLGLLGTGPRSAAAQKPPGGTFTVVLDAAHGGQDPGTEVSPQLLEKNLVLQLSIRLRSALTALGMRVVTTRETDIDPSSTDRAGIANHAGAQACLVLHATAGGTGVHLYTSSLAESTATPSQGSAQGLVPWSAAAAPFATRSLQLSSALGAAFSSASIPYSLGRVRLAPLDSMRCPTVAVEVAPLRPVDGHGSAAPLADSTGYQEQLVDAMAAALVAWRGQSAGGAK
jgi:N-acetylmuramoyl-L-alanine amidase